MQQDEIKPITEKQALKSMIIVAQDEITKAKIADRDYQRMVLDPKQQKISLPDGRQVDLKLVMGANQKRIRELQVTIHNYIEYMKTASDEIPLAKELGLDIIKK